MLDALRTNIRDARTLGAQSLLRHVPFAHPKGRHSWTLPDGTTISIRLGTTDIDVVRQIFQWRDYDLTRHAHHAEVQARYAALLAQGQVPVIIDAGANIGAASLYFARQFPRARIVAVEPEPANADCCRTNCAGVATIAVREAAIGSRPGRIVLDNPAGQAWAPRSTRDDSGAGIDIVTIGELVDAVPGGVPFIVKIDIEGFESDLFAENLDWLDSATVVIVEIHDWMMPGQGTSRTLQAAMGARDFELVISGENLVFFRVGASPVE